MILRRFMAHVKDQNWFAVGLDVLVVIVGIFLGMQVTEWNEDREKRAEEQQLLGRLLEDIETNTRLAKMRSDFYAVILDDGQLLLRYLESPSEVSVSPQRLVAAIYNSSQISPGNIDDTTYKEMSSSSKLGLISDVKIRDMLAAYYHSARGWERLWNLNPAGPHRTAVRSALSFQVQDEVFHTCEIIGRDYLDTLKVDCIWPGSHEAALAIVSQIESIPQLREMLNFRMGQVRLNSTLINLYYEISVELQGELSAAIKEHS